LERLSAEHKRKRESQERQLDKIMLQIRKQEEMQDEYLTIVRRNLNLVDDVLCNNPSIIEAQYLHVNLQDEARLAATNFEFHDEELKAERRSIERKMDSEHEQYRLEYLRIKESSDG